MHFILELWIDDKKSNTYQIFTGFVTLQSIQLFYPMVTKIRCSWFKIIASNLIVYFLEEHIIDQGSLSASL